MAVHRHVAAEEPGQVAELVVVHLGIAVALVIDLTDVDVGDWLALAHGPAHSCCSVASLLLQQAACISLTS
ncbi:hypothetical protein D3C76_1309100 [compost metagenome]